MAGTQLHNDLPVWTSDSCTYNGSASGLEDQTFDGWTPYELSNDGLSPQIVKLYEPRVVIGKDQESQSDYKYGNGNMTNVVALNFRNVKLPRAARVQKVHLQLRGLTLGSGAVDLRVSAVSNCNASAVGPNAPSNWKFPELVPLCEDLCNKSSLGGGGDVPVIYDLTRDGICDDGGQGSAYDACPHGHDCSDCPSRGYTGIGLPDWPFGPDGQSRQVSVEWQPMDWNGAFHDLGRRQSPDLSKILQPLVDEPSWPIDGGCQVSDAVRWAQDAARLKGASPDPE